MGQTRDGVQLGLAGFGLSVSSFAEQSETIEMHTPELALARTSTQAERMGEGGGGRGV